MAQADGGMTRWRATIAARLLMAPEFDSSYKRGQPTDVSSERRHQGMDGGAAADAGGIQSGSYSCRAFARPTVIARQAPSSAPDATLIFDVELVSIQDKSAAKTPTSG